METRLTFTDPSHENSVLREKVLVIGGGGGEGPEGSVKRTTEHDICRRLGLHGWQKTVCLRGQEMAEVLMEAVRLSVYHCQRQFLYERWNCSLDGYRQILKNGNNNSIVIVILVITINVIIICHRRCCYGCSDVRGRNFHQNYYSTNNKQQLPSTNIHDNFRN